MVQRTVSGCDGHLQGMTSEHDYADIPNFETVSPYKDAAISYIAGYVVRMMKRRITCITCTQALTTTETVHPFVALKVRGFLQKPSSSIVTVCKETEKCFQRLLKASGRNLVGNCHNTQGFRHPFRQPS